MSTVGRASVLLDPPFQFERSSLPIEPSLDPVLLLKLQSTSSMSQSQERPPKVDKHLESNSSGWAVSTRPASSQLRRNALSPLNSDLPEFQKGMIEEAAQAGLYDLSVCTAALSSIADTGDRESGKTGSIDSIR
jgi:hypothetical protein